MKVVDATWDTVTFGMPATEFLIEDGDSWFDFVEAERSLTSRGTPAHIVVRAPVNSPDFLYGLPAMGYTFIECAFNLSLKRDNFKSPKYLERFDRDVEVREFAQSDSVERVLAEIRRGVFDTDRVSLERGFSPDTARLRYVRWVQTVMERGTRPREIWFRGIPIGFFIVESLDGTYARGMLTGLYQRSETSGLGLVLMKKLKQFVWDAGHSVYLAQVASNNLKALRANLVFGTEIEGLGYNYVRTIR
jgi:hypothetical protein